MPQYPTIEQLYDKFLISSGVNTDTRTIQPNQFFIALKGKQFNGNEYAEEALDKGALYAIVDEEKFATSNQHLLVKDGLETLQQLATFHRKLLNIPLIGITGSNGKTTTKELIAAVLSTTYKCFYTQGNYNNHIGVPLSVLSITPQIEIAVIEMGANHVGEIAELSAIAQPNYGIITNIGTAHIEGFGSRENIKKGKGELYDYLKNTDSKTVFVNSDDEVLMTMAKSLNKVTYGTHGEDIKGEIRSENQFLKLKIEDKEQAFTIETKMVGEYNFYNALAAAAIGRFFNVSLLDVVEAIEQYNPQNNRSQLIKQNGRSIIVDAYNANPSSMVAALKSFSKNKSKNKLAILGHMLELGQISKKEHIEIAQFLNQHQIDALLVGEEFQSAAKKEKIPWVKTAIEAKQWLAKQGLQYDTILLKGSRGIELERILD